ncbi:MAG: mitochondrial import inner membrane translocase subunit tim54 [Chaenotheca gracillima]|nr:MAG: mitochondrial import inner membrane translocase subunit tim54 [Chaenotheca gracillima]
MPPPNVQQKKYVQTVINPSFFNAQATGDAGSSKASPYFSRSIVPSSEQPTSQTEKDRQGATGRTSESQTIERRTTPRRHDEELARVAVETREVLPELLQSMPWARPIGVLYVPSDLTILEPSFSPRFLLPPDDLLGRAGELGTRIQVVNGDSFDVAIDVLYKSEATKDTRPVAVLNLANAKHGGGGWLQGALAQEEALCYRSSLSFTLKRRFYPLPEISGVYSPTVVVFRDAISAGHHLMDLSDPRSLPVLSVISAAAIRDPVVTQTVPPRYRRREDRDVMKLKMGMILRIAVIKRHRRLVLGALGCGAFANPPEDVAECWKEVFAENEFQQGWFESVIFAVMGEGPNSNFEIFQKVLQDLVV